MFFFTMYLEAVAFFLFEEELSIIRTTFPTSDALKELQIDSSDEDNFLFLSIRVE